MTERKLRSPSEITQREIRSLIKERVESSHPTRNVGNLQETLEEILWDFRLSEWSDEDVYQILESIILPFYFEAIINSPTLREFIKDLWDDCFTGGESDLLDDAYYLVTHDSNDCVGQSERTIPEW